MKRTFLLPAAVCGLCVSTAGATQAGRASASPAVRADCTVEAPDRVSGLALYWTEAADLSGNPAPGASEVLRHSSYAFIASKSATPVGSFVPEIGLHLNDRKLVSGGDPGWGGMYFGSARIELPVPMEEERLDDDKLSVTFSAAGRPAFPLSNVFATEETDEDGISATLVIGRIEDESRSAFIDAIAAGARSAPLTLTVRYDGRVLGAASFTRADAKALYDTVERDWRTIDAAYKAGRCSRPFEQQFGPER